MGDGVGVGAGGVGAHEGGEVLHERSWGEEGAF